MKPKDAARIFDSLNDDVLVPVAQEMKSDVLAPVLAAMNPDAGPEADRQAGQQADLARHQRSRRTGPGCHRPAGRSGCPCSRRPAGSARGTAGGGQSTGGSGA